MPAENYDITYGVFWKSDRYGDPEKWYMFGSWMIDYDDAVNMARNLRVTDPGCLATKIVERVETFEDMPGTYWKRS